MRVYIYKKKIGNCTGHPITPLSLSFGAQAIKRKKICQARNMTGQAQQLHAYNWMCHKHIMGHQIMTFFNMGISSNAKVLGVTFTFLYSFYRNNNK